MFGTLLQVLSAGPFFVFRNMKGSDPMLKKFCRKQGCQNLTDSGYCPDHQQQAQAYDQHRESAAKRGYDARWRKARLNFLKQHPLCVECLDKGFVIAATDVDHIVAHKGDKQLFWDPKNWQPLCKSHHSMKTVKEDGGFGRS